MTINASSKVVYGSVNNFLSKESIESIVINTTTGKLIITSGRYGLNDNDFKILSNIVFGTNNEFQSTIDFSDTGFFEAQFYDTILGSYLLRYNGIPLSYDSVSSGGEINQSPNKSFYWNIGNTTTFVAGSVNYLNIRYITQPETIINFKNTFSTSVTSRSKSNLYAERVFLQHPLALWPLDDDISYIQLFSEKQKDLSNLYYWNLQNVEVLGNINYDLKTNLNYPGFNVTEKIRSNVIPFDSFEQTVFNKGLIFNTGTDVSITSEDSLFGTNSLRIKFPVTFPPLQPSIGFTYGSLPDIQNSKNYMFSCYIKQKSVITGTYRVRIEEYNGLTLISNTVVASKQLTSIDGRWYRLYGKWQSSSSATTYKLIIEVTEGKDQEIYLDGILLENEESILPYFDDIEDEYIIEKITDLDVKRTISYYDTGTPNIRFYNTSSAAYFESIFEISTASATYDTYFDKNKSTACFSAYAYIEQATVKSIEIGIIDSVSGQSSTIRPVIGETGWIKLSHTFTLQKNRNLKFFIRCLYDSNYSNIQFAALSFGQWSENYNSYSIGYTPSNLLTKLQSEDISSNIINNSSLYSYRIADSYGLDKSLDGMYLIKNNTAFAETYGVPLVYGSTNTTKIYEAEDSNPSIILPGQGFLNESGKYNSYTFEAWIRLDNVSITPIRIIGPTKSNDGIYVEEGFITLRVGDYSKSYFVGKWYRPILLNVSYTPRNISMFINGSEVISIDISGDNITTFPIKDYDWIGIYGNSLVQPFEIDCISIYPYVVPPTLLKKRFVYGQGTGELKISNNEIDAKTALIDYSNAGYATNVIYPDVSKWSDGAGVNVQSNSSFLTTPEYSLPEIQLSNNSSFLKSSEWLKSNFYYNKYSSEYIYPFFVMNPSTVSQWSTTIDDANLWSTYAELNWGQLESSKSNWQVTFKNPLPNGVLTWAENKDETWGSILTSENTKLSQYDAESTIYFKNINTIDADIQSIVGVFRTTSSSASYQSIMYFKHNITKDYLEIYVDGADVKYSYNGEILNTVNVGFNKHFVAGINLSNFSNKYFNKVKNFFDNPSLISLNIGGNFTKSFTGRIYAIHFSNNFFYEKDLSTYFDIDNVYPKQDSVYSFMNYTANYSLIPVLYNSTMVLDIATCSYWEDYHPLSYFGKYINNTSANTSYYDLDMLQFNADVPNKIKNYSFIYQDLKDLYVKYEDLQTGNLQSTANYSNYQQLKTTEETTFVNNELDTGIKMYLSFQGIQDVGKILYKDLVEQSLGSAKVITFNENTYQNKKYELQDRTIIIPPKFPKFKDYYVGLHMEYKVRGINTKKIAIRRMELASLAFDETSNYSIGTRYGDKIYPFVRDNNTFIYKQDNPFTIYKQTSPYLYLTEDSGIYINDYLLSPSLSASAVRGAYIEINSNKEDDFELAGVQLWCRYPEDQMPTNNFKIASIVSTSRTIDIWAYPELNRKRAKIVAIENNSELYDLIFYSDGNAVQYPYINTETWSSIAISLKSIFDLSGITGRLELYNGLTYNNISTYKYLSKVVGISVQQELSWLNITTVINPLSTWNNIKTKYSSWSAFPSELVKTGAYAIDADKVYNSSVGLANTVNEDSSNITIISNGVDTFTDVDLQLIEVVPV